MSDFNSQIVEEFRANGGKVASFEGRPLLLLHTTGAKSGVERVHPLMYQAIGDAFAVFASKAGAPANPGWYYNLLENPDTQVEIGGEAIPVTARIATGPERDEIWARQKQQFPNFAEYEDRTTRTIPVVILERSR